MKPFTTIAAVLFFIISCAHVLRLSAHWQVTVNNMIIPQWVSIPGFLIAGVLALMLWHEARK